MDRFTERINRITDEVYRDSIAEETQPAPASTPDLPSEYNKIIRR